MGDGGRQMLENERVQTVKRLLLEYVQSPSVKHIRDTNSITKLAKEIVAALDRASSIWKKWDGDRETLLKSALCCWIPAEDMWAYLNTMPGPKLTKTDVSARFQAFLKEEYCFEYPRHELKKGCLEIYRREKAEGTELPAIIQLLSEHVEKKEERLHHDQREFFQKVREQQRKEAEARLMAGADCGWTPLAKSPHVFCRINGRTYRLSPDKHDKTMKVLHRVEAVSEVEGSVILGRYRTRGEASKALKEIAYKEEPDSWRR
jgi:hypothetical protein